MGLFRAGLQTYHHPFRKDGEIGIKSQKMAYKFAYVIFFCIFGRRLACGNSPEISS